MNKEIGSASPKERPGGRVLPSTDLVQRIVDTIVKRADPDKIYVFGSWARGEAGRNSDLDLLIVMESSLPPPKRGAWIRLLIDADACPLDILVVTPGEVSYWYGTPNHIITTAIDNGILIYERPGTRTGSAVVG